jgi:molybdopterin/thiamine biosynthesis adenylyltransferase
VQSIDTLCPVRIYTDNTFTHVDSVGQLKSEVAAQKLTRINLDVEVAPILESLNSNPANDLIHGVDVVLDGLDRPEPW